MPRQSRPRRTRGRPPPPRRSPAAPERDPGTGLRGLIQTGIVATAAVEADADLARAAASMHRLGTLTSGVWRALSRELASAAERLDGQVHDHLDEVRRRAQALDVDPDQVLAAGAAAAHLHEHRQTLEELLPTLEEDVGRLAAADVLLGFSIEDEVLTDEQDQDDNMDEAASGAEGSDDELDEPSSAGVRIRLFLWPAPLTPAQVMIAPDLVEQTMTDTNIALNVQVEAADALVDALATTCGLPAERALPALSALGLACWSAHQGDEHGDLDDDDDDVGADDADDE